HAATIAGKGWTRHDVREYLHMNAYNLFGRLAFDHRYGKVYNRNLPRWYKREPDSRIPIVPSPDHIHLFVIGGAAGRFSAFIPGWGICPRRCCAASTGWMRTGRRSASTAPAIYERGAKKGYETVFDPRGVVEAERMALADRATALIG